MREEVREHRLEELTSLIPPPTTELARARRVRMNPGASLLPTILIDSDEKVQSRKKSKRHLRKYVYLVASLIGTWVAIELISDHLPSTAWRTTVNPVSMHRNYAHLNGLDDLSSELVEPWCFNRRPTCGCTDPMVAKGRVELRHWDKIHSLNVEAAKAREDDVDVLFLGDSITEGWRGTSYGHASPRAHDVPKVFKSYFSTQDGGKYEGLALGISGDTSPNLLWRIQNGELPDGLNPSVIWVLIGTNDFGSTWCSAELVLIGIIRVVEELRIRRPGSKIVINGLLPRTFDRKGYVARGRPRRWWKSTSRPALPSLWDDIEAVNDELKQYVAGHSRMEYFETSVFFEDKSVPEEQLRINGKLMPDFLHPSAEGYQLWGEEIARKLEQILPK